MAQETKKKLSTLIREGITLRPQVSTNVKSVYGSAMDTLYEAITGHYPALCESTQLIDTIYQSTGVLFDHPDPVGLAISNEMIERSDRGETREEIAAWLESIGQ